MCCGGKAAKDPHAVVGLDSVPQHTGNDGRLYPVYVWIVCPDSDDPTILLGTDDNWSDAQGRSLIGGCTFSGSRSILFDPPTRGHWVA